nr:hypothetical protein [Tanacetum cinerariifolium]
MKNNVSTLSKSDLEDLIKAFRIPLDLHPRLPNFTFTMDRLPSDAIGVYSEFLWFSSVQVPFLTFLLFVLKYFKRHSYSCVSDDLPADGYNRSDVEQLRAHLIYLREMKEELLVQMSIYDFMTLPSWDDAKIVKEPHRLFEPLLERISSHTTAPAAEGALIPFPTLDEVRPALATVFEPSQPSKKRRLKKRTSKAGSNYLELEQVEGLNEANITDFGVKLEDSGCFGTPRLGKRLGLPHSVTVTSVSGLAHVGTLAHASTSGRSLALGDALACNALSRDVEDDEIPKDEFGTVTRDPNVCRKALDRTITPAELRRTESLLLLELSNRVNVLSALLVSHGYELNSRYTNLVASKVRLQEKFDRKKGDVKLLRSEVTSLDKNLEKALTVRDLHNELALERLLSSDDFHDALAQVTSLGIDYGVERGLRMGRTDADFEVVAQKVFNFHIDAEADFNKALVAFPTTSFPFFSKVDVATGGALFEVTQIFAG